jgi:predicted phage terminase large subunit-like protein
VFDYDTAQARCKAVAARDDLSRSKKLEIIEEIRVRSAREDFYSFRMYMHPKNKSGWWQRDVAEHLHQFYLDLKAGKRPKLVIEAPPQHGKSVQIVDFIAWVAGHDGDLRTIYTSFSERLGVRANLSTQRMMGGARFQKVFPNLKIPTRNSVTISSQKLRNREIIEYCDHDGYFRNTTVGGSITGESLDLGVIDDPIKGRKEANSTTTRNSVWDWFTDDFLTRFSEDAGLLSILTRWHVDDPIGRMIERMGDVKVCKYPALAEPGVKLIPSDKRVEGSGEALFPEHKSRGFVLERKAAMPDANFTALYQQSPYVAGGGLIKGSWFQRYDKLPKLKYRAIFADTALKAKQANDYQVAEVWGLGVDGNAYLIDILRDKFEAWELEKRFPDFWHKHKSLDTGRLRYFAIEDKASGTELIQRMKNTIKPKIPVKAIPRSTDKVERVNDVVPHIKCGNVYIPENAPWVSDFVSECEAFTADDAHDHDDQIDPMCDAIVDLLDHATGNVKDML